MGPELTHGLGAQCLAAAGAGLVLGVIHFVGLHWTVKMVAESRRGVMLVGLSSVARTVLLVAGLYVVAAGQPLALACALLGVIAARSWLVRRLGRLAGAAPPTVTGPHPASRGDR